MIIADVVFERAEDGGRRTPAMSGYGYRPQLRIDKESTSTVIRALDDNTVLFRPGLVYRVVLEPILWSLYEERFDPSAAIELLEGSRRVATGEFVAFEADYDANREDACTPQRLVNEREAWDLVAAAEPKEVQELMGGMLTALSLGEGDPAPGGPIDAAYVIASLEVFARHRLYIEGALTGRPVKWYMTTFEG